MLGLRLCCRRLNALEDLGTWASFSFCAEPCITSLSTEAARPIAQRVRVGPAWPSGGRGGRASPAPVGGGSCTQGRAPPAGADPLVLGAPGLPLAGRRRPGAQPLACQPRGHAGRSFETVRCLLRGHGLHAPLFFPLPPDPIGFPQVPSGSPGPPSSTPQATPSPRRSREVPSAFVPQAPLLPQDPPRGAPGPPPGRGRVVPSRWRDPGVLPPAGGGGSGPVPGPRWACAVGGQSARCRRGPGPRRLCGLSAPRRAPPSRNRWLPWAGGGWADQSQVRSEALAWKPLRGGASLWASGWAVERRVQTWSRLRPGSA